jgi:hypothetical protein
VISLRDHSVGFTEKIHQGWIFCIKVSLDGTKLFTSDTFGNLKFFGIAVEGGPWGQGVGLCLKKDFGPVDSGINYSMALTDDGQFLFTSDSGGCLKKFSIEDESLVKDYGKICEGGILAIAI